MFTGVKFYTSVVFLKYSSCSGLCHIYSWFLIMSWVLSLSILLSICRVYIYVRLIKKLKNVSCEYNRLNG